MPSGDGTTGLSVAWRDRYVRIVLVTMHSMVMESCTFFPMTSPPCVAGTYEQAEYPNVVVRQ